MNSDIQHDERQRHWDNSVHSRVNWLPLELQELIDYYWWPTEKRRREFLIFPFFTKELPLSCVEELYELKNANKKTELMKLKNYLAGMQLYSRGINRVSVIRRLLSNPNYVSIGEMQAYELRNDPDMLKYIEVYRKILQLEYSNTSTEES